jgi:hypothetical protein
VDATFPYDNDEFFGGENITIDFVHVRHCPEHQAPVATGLHVRKGDSAPIIANGNI